MILSKSARRDAVLRQRDVDTGWRQAMHAAAEGRDMVSPAVALRCVPWHCLSCVVVCRLGSWVVG
ncbi:hypothetical protein [Xylella fastidiosa]|uniref:hypothetical protein n=1 Tax=Xylella fastidiosa TaxID=2371 RepID=UPI000417ED8D|nr:hypothetical protein [Xylella fastidiosa]